MAWLFWVVPWPGLFGFYLWCYTALSAWGMFLFARAKGYGAQGAFFAAVAFSFSGKTAAHVFAGHLELLTAALCLPWVMWATEHLLQRPGFWNAVRLAAVLSVAATMGSVQMLYWHILFVLAYAGLEAALRVRQDGHRAVLRRLSFLAVAQALFLMMSAAWWFPIVRQTLLLSARGEGGGFAFATMASARIEDLVRFLWPYSGVAPPDPGAGDGANGFFWETASYPGVVTLALAAAMVVFVWRDRRCVGLAVLGLAAVLVSLGRDSVFYTLLYHVVPGFSLFRGPGRLLFYANFALAVVAGSALNPTAKERPANRWIMLLVFGLLLQGVFITTLVMPGTPVDPSRGRLVPLVVLAVIAAVSLAWCYGKLGRAKWGAVCIGVLLGEMVIAWHGLVPVAPAEKLLGENSIVAFLSERRDEGPFRIYDPTLTVPQKLAARHGLEIITGYHPGIYKHHLEMYRRLWENDASDIVQLHMHSPADVTCPALLDTMNVRYVVAYEADLGQGYEPVFTSPPGELSPPRSIFERTSVLPRAYVVAAATVPDGGRDVLDALCSGNPREQCWVAADPVPGDAQFQALDCVWKTPSDGGATFDTEASGMVVIAQSWHPDWRATDHGDAVPVRRVNHGQLGVPIGPGAHALRVWYSPWDFYLGLAVSGTTIGLLAVAWLSGTVRSRRRRLRSQP